MTEIEKAKKLSEVSKKVDSAAREVQTKRKYVDSDILFKRDTTQSASDLRHAVKKLESLEKERDSLK